MSWLKTNKNEIKFIEDDKLTTDNSFASELWEFREITQALHILPVFC